MQREFPLFVNTYHLLRAEGLPFKEQYQPGRPPVLDPGAGSLLDRSASAAQGVALGKGGGHGRAGKGRGHGGGGTPGGGDSASVNGELGVLSGAWWRLSGMAIFLAVCRLVKSGVDPVFTAGISRRHADSWRGDGIGVGGRLRSWGRLVVCLPTFTRPLPFPKSCLSCLILLQKRPSDGERFLVDADMLKLLLIYPFRFAFVRSIFVIRIFFLFFFLLLIILPSFVRLLFLFLFLFLLFSLATGALSRNTFSSFAPPPVTPSLMSPVTLFAIRRPHLLSRNRMFY